jgi:hypothetical protein
MAYKTCKFCGSRDNVSRVKKKFHVCGTCKPAVYAVLNMPGVIEQAWPLLHDRAILPQVRRIKIPWKTELPEELDAKRYRSEDRDSNLWYLIVSQFNGKPVELFMSTAGESDHKLQSNIANLTALTRLVSLMLRHVFLGEQITIDKIKNQLRKSSRQKKDLPDLVLDVLNK